jgi:hypothetical protein
MDHFNFRWHTIEKGNPIAVKIIVKRQVTESMTAQLMPLLVKLLKVVFLYIRLVCAG